MTLFEVMVAIVIILFLGIAGMTALSNAIEMKDLLAERDETTRAARVTMGRLRREVQLAFLTNTQGDRERYRTEFISNDSDPDSLVFASFSHQRMYRNSHESDQTEITVWAEAERGGQGYTLYHREAPRIDGKLDEGGVVYPIAHNVRSFNLRFLDNQTNEWRDDWNTSKPDTANRLPRAVEIGLVLIGRDPEDEDRTIDIPFLTTVTLQYADPLKREVQ